MHMFFLGLDKKYFEEDHYKRMWFSHRYASFVKKTIQNGEIWMFVSKDLSHKNTLPAIGITTSEKPGMASLSLERDSLFIMLKW